MIAAWLAGSAVIGGMGLDAGYGLGFINILFGVGMAAGLVSRRGGMPAPGVVAAIGAVLLLATGVDDVVWNALARPVQIIGYGTGSALALTGCIEMERRGWFSCPRLVMAVGAASYSIYLTHILVLALVTRLLRIFGLTTVLPGPLAFAGLLVISVGAGMVVHVTAERRIVDYVRRRMEQGVPGAAGVVTRTICCIVICVTHELLYELPNHGMAVRKRP